MLYKSGSSTRASKNEESCASCWIKYPAVGIEELPDSEVEVVSGCEVDELPGFEVVLVEVVSSFEVEVEELPLKLPYPAVPHNKNRH